MTATETEAPVTDAEIVEPDQADSPAEPETAPADTEAETAEIVQPAELVKASGTVEFRTPRGHLSLRPDQNVLSPDQNAALQAIGIDVQKDPGVWPHLRAFVHMCQLRTLDPFAKEAYLIGRGEGEWRKYTMQISIDGFRKLHASTGRFRRVKKVLWTGKDDDDKSWTAVVGDDGDVEMRRVWYDQWPESRGYPGAAKVVIEHWDERGDLTTTSAIADWNFYAPMNPKYEGKWPNKRKVLDEQGNEVMVVAEMWAKGFQHMLAKCAEALAHRKASPNTMNGFYANEEMHRLDNDEKQRKASRQDTDRQKAFAAAKVRELPPEVSTDPAARTITPARAGEPVPAEQAVSETFAALRRTQDVLANERAQVTDERAQQDAHAVESARADEPGERAPRAHVSAAPLSDAERVTGFREELLKISGVLGQPVERLVLRTERQRQRPYADFTADDLWVAVQMLRPAVIARMRAINDERAENYARVPDGRPAPGEVWDDSYQDPSEPHPFVDSGSGVCWCDRMPDETIHML